ncbi:hypothetical protein M422DRAFT_259219 [Sphaerobolus stellatus SS14]|uniref:Uncharacterized protein n=1 Tax=Sphaerobolus stellatus (strain SS14) TaxID=990650 RepID=A0A0C9VKP4_SPHS4|nr:hypothetical protein M422DRAFT_259219 [Sphaerobolus stellatus SS14]
MRISHLRPSTSPPRLPASRTPTPHQKCPEPHEAGCTQAQITLLNALRAVVASHLALRNLHQHPFNDISLPQHRYPRDCLPHMAYTSPILHHLLPACLIPAPRRPNLRKPDFIPRHRVPLYSHSSCGRSSPPTTARS